MNKRSRSPSPRRRYDDREREYNPDVRSSRADKYSSRDNHDSRHSRHRSRSRDRDNASSRRKDRSRSKDGDRKDKKRKRDKSEERRARKAEKKRIKEEEEARQVAELSVYSATDNPFHDVNLGQQFRWHKKNEKERKQGISISEAQRRDAIRREEAKEELERLNRRRAEREVDQRLREEEELRNQRFQESAQMSDWLAKEGDFQLEQENKRAAIRIKEKRAKAVDFLALNLKYVNPAADGDENAEEDAGLEIDLDEPYNIFDNLTVPQVEELHNDIQRYLTLEASDVNLDFWTNMMVVCKDRLETLQNSQHLGVEAAAAVEADIATLLSGKTYDDLTSLQRQVQSKLTSGEPVDTDYWESLLKKLLVYKAKAKLKSLHEVVVRNRLEQLRKKQRDEALQAQEELLAGVARTASKKWNNDVTPVEVAQEEVVPSEEIEQYDRAMSPQLLDITKLPAEERDIDIVTETEALRALLEQRRAVASSRFVAKASQPQVEIQNEEAPSNADLASEALYRAEAERDLDEEEELFNLEENIAHPTSYHWEDKYRPRKPRYFNRVHTGYEWNKYNQTHYDTDNPPPKVVQGYKFNIFYPDLIDKSKAPTYKIVKEPGNDETVLLHFSAGPPYEDIAFRIVDREWEFSHKRSLNRELPPPASFNFADKSMVYDTSHHSSNLFLPYTAPASSVCTEWSRKRVRFAANLPESYFSPFAEWVAYRCNTLFTETPTEDMLLMTRREEGYLAKKINLILQAVNGGDATTLTFLALWYLDRLIPDGLFNSRDVELLDATEAITRGFLLGLTLADKWLNDRSKKLSDWSRFCHLPLCYRNVAERTALRLLDYNIGISRREWFDWLRSLEQSTQNFYPVTFTHSAQISPRIALSAVRGKVMISAPLLGSSASRSTGTLNAELQDRLRQALLYD
ncbi:hypothetical protein H0H93_008400 [Arthromyces matolae]|nr:hypothetical protein H0H93_008400 [Arthromyces matolae]